eukprot:2055803-Pyramimonas_sp.AAC.1
MHANVWGADGHIDALVKNLKADIDNFCSATGVEENMQLNDMTTGMMGKPEALSMKLKAAESMMLLPFAIRMCE